MNAQKERVYISVPVDMLTRKQAEKLAHETAALLDMEKQEPVFNLGLDAPWEHLSRAMRLLGECDAVLFAPGWDYFPTLSAQSSLRRLSERTKSACTAGAMQRGICAPST